ncbi:MAG: hypothetical protein DHS20C05_02520 [Hyphococcus sp.]|nr:MAG: hypothetical protein DHS20C05_02520 [Marinicaulis sp.]
MKKPFNAKASQTYASREAELEAHAKKIDEFLRTPPKPGQFYQPKGVGSAKSHSLAHDALTQKRVDIAQELEGIKTDMAKRHTVTPSQKVQAKSL